MRLPLRKSFNVFKHSVTCYDEQTEIVDYEPNQTRSEQYKIMGIIQKVSQPSNTMTADGQEFVIEQQIHTNTKLHVMDNNNSKQTFVVYCGFTYKVVSMSQMGEHINGGINKYGLVRYERY